MVGTRRARKCSERRGARCRHTIQEWICRVGSTWRITRGRLHGEMKGIHELHSRFQNMAQEVLSVSTPPGIWTSEDLCDRSHTHRFPRNSTN